MRIFIVVKSHALGEEIGFEKSDVIGPLLLLYFCIQNV